jgi:hypothetical protein
MHLLRIKCTICQIYSVEFTKLYGVSCVLGKTCRSVKYYKRQLRSWTHEIGSIVTLFDQ